MPKETEITDEEKIICSNSGVNDKSQEEETKNLNSNLNADVNKMTCMCCPITNRQCKKTNLGDYMHIACAKWNPYVKNITKDLIYISKWPKSNNKCYICNKTIGYINKCDHSSKSTRCNNYFHVSCLIEDGSLINNNDYTLDSKFYCKLHSLVGEKGLKVKIRKNRINDDDNDESYTVENEEEEKNNEEDVDNNEKSCIKSDKEDSEDSNINFGCFEEKKKKISSAISNDKNSINKRQKINEEDEEKNKNKIKEDKTKSLNNYLNDYIFEQKVFISDLENFIHPYIKAKKAHDSNGVNNENIIETVKLEKKLKNCESLIGKSKNDFQIESNLNNQYRHQIEQLNNEIKYYKNNYLRIKEAWHDIIKSLNLIPFCGLKPDYIFDEDCSEEILFFIKNKLSKDKNLSHFFRNIINNILIDNNININDDTNKNRNFNYSSKYKGNKNNININTNKNNEIYNINSNNNNSFNNKFNDDNNNKLNRTSSMMNKSSSSIMNNNNINNKKYLNIDKNGEGKDTDFDNEILKSENNRNSDTKPNENLNYSSINEKLKKIESEDSNDKVKSSTYLKQDLNNENNHYNKINKDSLNIMKGPLKNESITMNKDKKNLFDKEYNNEVEQDNNNLENSMRLTQNINDNEGVLFFIHF
ncbi:hypothetical protein H8356DRAFT_1309250 [Neocallimastix lanati (nom. inval.)]|nr:hypothetical protein H8356DRAFT_1309250 [Neocallimastix sp. JGI-2020a]